MEKSVRKSAILMILPLILFLTVFPFLYMVFMSSHYYNLLEWKPPYFRSIILIPMMIPAVAAGVMWKMLFSIELSSSIENIVSYLRNSLIIALITSAICIIIFSLVAYSIARFKTGEKGLAVWIVYIRMLPPIATVLPFSSFKSQTLPIF